MTPGHEKLAAIAADPARAAILLDFDGTLAPIVTWPEVASAAPGAREVLASLAGRFLLVAVISGRPTDALERLLGVDGVRYEGLYGLATVAAGSGFLAVFVSGIVLGDAAAPFKAEVERFHASLASLAEIIAFVALGVTVSLSRLVDSEIGRAHV